MTAILVYTDIRSLGKAKLLIIKIIVYSNSKAERILPMPALKKGESRKVVIKTTSNWRYYGYLRQFASFLAGVSRCVFQQLVDFARFLGLLLAVPTASFIKRIGDVMRSPESADAKPLSPV
ncbi:MAG: hypothetical protein AAFW84_25975 [Cyanobacteria bacterium J06635_15]